jgi:hypothetical protein
MNAHKGRGDIRAHLFHPQGGATSENLPCYPLIYRAGEKPYRNLLVSGE